MTDRLTFEILRKSVEEAAAFRCRRRLQPAGGEGDKVFPPTFAGAVYALEKRRVPGRTDPVPCVLLDSVQSQANRMEQALQDALDAGRLSLPHVVVDFSAWDPTGGPAREDRLIEAIGRLTSLQVPHRLADAILRDSLAGGVPFRDSVQGRELNDAGPANATPVFGMCPTALLFGMWDSTVRKGGLGAKFERAIVSEVVGVGAEVGDLRRGVRRDPLEIRAEVKVVKKPGGAWRPADGDDRPGRGEEEKVVAPSEINHSSVPFPKQRERKTDENFYDGVTIEYAEQITTLSLIVLRRLRFPVNGSRSHEVDLAARTVLAALGLTAATLAFESGLGLRSRCLLWPEGPMVWELLDRPGQAPRRFELEGKDAIGLLEEAVASATEKGLPWPKEPLSLTPSPNLIKIVGRSQTLAIKAEGGE